MRTKFISIAFCFLLPFLAADYNLQKHLPNSQGSVPIFEIKDLESVPVEYESQRTLLIQFTLVNSGFENATDVNFLVILPNNLRLVADWITPNLAGPSVSVRDNRWLTQWSYPQFGSGQSTRLEIPVQVLDASPDATYEILTVYNSNQTPSPRNAGTILVKTSEDLQRPPEIKLSSTEDSIIPISPTPTFTPTSLPPTPTVVPTPTHTPIPSSILSPPRRFSFLYILVTFGGCIFGIGILVFVVYFFLRRGKDTKQGEVIPQSFQTGDEQRTSSVSTITPREAPANRVRVVAAGGTDTGRRRDLNEDGYLIREDYLDDGSHSFVGLYVIADGMGGHNSGDIASKIVIDTFDQQLQKSLNTIKSHREKAAFEPISWLNETIMLANQQVFKEHKLSGSRMGSTLVGVLVIDNMAFIGHVGDSRVYLLREERITALTKDHSVVQELLDANKLTIDEAKKHPESGVIYRAIGIKSKVKPDFTKQELQNRDIILLCSDGLNSSVSDANILKITVNSPSSNEACRRLINAANSMGGEDNITVIVAQAEFV